MDIQQFAEKMQCRIRKLMGEDTEVLIKKVCKNNGVTMHGLIINRKDKNVSPTIYLEPFMEMYERGNTLSEVADHIMSVYVSGSPKQNIDMEFFKEFDKVKKRIVYRVINKEKNEELLKQIPHICFLDLAICFYYAYSNKILGNGMIMVYNTHVDLWETSAKDLFSLAQKNTPRLFEVECNTMESVVAELVGKERAEGDMFAEGVKAASCEDLTLWVLSNKKRSHGAASILYPGALQHISDFFSGSFYVLPSSIHEVIIIEDKEQNDSQYLREMVREVNRAQVEPVEILSDNVYYYDYYQKELKIV